MARILLVEDEISWINLHTRFLSTAGNEIQLASSFDAAVTMLRGKQKFDLIVFDLYLTHNPGDDPYVWISALIEGFKSDRVSVPPIVIVTGLDLPKPQIIRAFTEFRGHVYGFFEKSNFDSREFLNCVKAAISTTSSYSSRPRSIFYLFSFAIMMVTIVLSIFAVLIWSVKQIPDPNSQQTILQVGGAVIVVVAIFITVFNQNTKLENIIESISKIWRG